jgi:hypothetical protein
MYKTGGGEELIEEVEVEKVEGGLVYFWKGEGVNKRKAAARIWGVERYFYSKELAKDDLLKEVENQLRISQMKVRICEEQIKKIEEL